MAVWYGRRSLHSRGIHCIRVALFFLTTDDTLYRVPDNFVAVGGMYVGRNGKNDVSDSASVQTRSACSNLFSGCRKLSASGDLSQNACSIWKCMCPKTTMND